MNLTNKKYILPFYYPSAPNPSVMMQLEIRVVKNPSHKEYGKCSIYTDSHYNPIKNEVDAIDMSGYMTIEQAEEILKRHNCIPVKSHFDQYNVDDLREIKHLLSEEWIKGYNEHQSMF